MAGSSHPGLPDFEIVPILIAHKATPKLWHKVCKTPGRSEQWLDVFAKKPVEKWSANAMATFASLARAEAAKEREMAADAAKPVMGVPVVQPVPLFEPVAPPPTDIFANAQRLFAVEKERLMNLSTTSPAERNNMAPYCMVFDPKPTMRLGQCRYRRQEVGFSTKVLQCGFSDKMILATITHELCHAATPGAAHGPAWKKIMKRAGVENPRCFCSKEESALMRAGIKRKYLLYCPVGGPEGKNGCCAQLRDRNTAKIKRGRLICSKCKKAGVNSYLILKQQF